MKNFVIIQPPLVQLNTPYPSGAYLSSFFKNEKPFNSKENSVFWWDLSIELFHAVFSKKGLRFIFNESKDKALELAKSYEQSGDENSAFQLRRYICESDLWISWIDIIVSILCGKSPSVSKSAENQNSFQESNFIYGMEFCHEFVRSAHVPRGNRVEHFLSELNRNPSVEDSKILASLALADIADFITVVYDKNFSLIRYAESATESFPNLNFLSENTDFPILKNFLKPILQNKLSSITGETLFCITIPFSGTFIPAVFCADVIKNFSSLKNNCLIAFGGGFVNTELRTYKKTFLFNYCDFLSFDKGYGSYIDLFSNSTNIDSVKKVMNGRKFYKLKYVYNNSVVDCIENSSDYEKKEEQIVQTLIPDFSSADFSKYPCLADDTNPMHRIWNDGRWIKIYLAYGCYWHRCAFCDTSLDYVNNFCSTNVSLLFKNIYHQAELCGIHGIHFVDEACPPKSLQQFALENCSSSIKNRLSFWGNIRFEKTFSRDLADLLSYGGLTAVSGGIEIATGKGLDSINKGTEIEHIVASCCAFKEAGILIHAYMIFGFWNQTEQDLIDSMETLRQLFSFGLLDSAFWHKFSLTRYSTVFKEWQQGLHPDLQPILQDKNSFMENEIHFKGEEKSQKYSEPLNSALNFWMHGEKLTKKVESYFPFKMPKPSIPENFVESLVERYEQKRNSLFKEEPNLSKKFVWIGGSPILIKEKNNVQLCWSYMGDLNYASVPKEQSELICNFLKNISVANFVNSEKELFTYEKIISVIGKKLFSVLRGKGLCGLI